MENGVSEKVLTILSKIQDKAYVDNAIDILSEQLIPFFYSEWDAPDSKE